jgi:retinol dehydrogenase 12
MSLSNEHPQSDLGRQFKTNIFMIAIVWLFYNLARTTEQGSRIYVSAVNQGAESQGQIWKDDRFYDGGEMIGTSQGDELAVKVWKELVEVLQKADPSVKSVLESR